MSLLKRKSSLLFVEQTNKRFKSDIKGVENDSILLEAALSLQDLAATSPRSTTSERNDLSSDSEESPVFLTRKLLTPGDDDNLPPPKFVESKKVSIPIPIKPSPPRTLTSLSPDGKNLQFIRSFSNSTDHLKRAISFALSFIFNSLSEKSRFQAVITVHDEFDRLAHYMGPMFHTIFPIIQPIVAQSLLLISRQHSLQQSSPTQ